MQTPILVGVAQVEQRVDDLADAREPLVLMIEAIGKAAQDAGCPALLKNASSVRVIRGVWPYKNPARAVAEAIGCASAETVMAPFGGNYVQTTVNASALEIQEGSKDIIIITGAECGNTWARTRRAGNRVEWSELPGTPDRMIAEDKPMAHELEMALNIKAPIQVYPMFENALRHQLGETIDQHIKRVSDLWAGFSAVAADNPHAWIREAKSAEEIRTPSNINRPVSFPYPKFMNSNNNVDQGAALIMCSVSKAKELGIDERRWLYPWAGTEAHDHNFVSNRDNLYSSPGIRTAGGRVLEMTGLTPDALDRVDVYSCFPSAVQVAAREIGLDTSRPLTVTGGLTFAGGPMNNYVMHSIARMADLLRDVPGTKGLITANGGYLTKHAFGIYSTDEPAQPYRHESPQAQVDAMPKREVVAGHEGRAEVESYTVMYGAKGPSISYMACLLPDGDRVWA
ncbi:MAG: acetyl-CoA acetyltransferase, partial [Proteobacteria bacterium]|nr:acetyl-CoA acetyltransferase [Pseudomonadota bacterium]